MNGVTTVPYVYQTPAYQGVKVGDGQYLTSPQGMTTEEFKEDLKKNNPQLYKALEEIDKKCPHRELTEEERKKLEETRLKGFAPPKMSSVKKVLTKLESWIAKQAEKPHRVTMDDIQTYIDNGSKIKDIIMVPHHSNLTNDQDGNGINQIA